MRSFGITVVSIVGFIIMWQIICTLGFFSATLLPSPARTFIAGIKLFSDTRILSDMYATAYRFVASFALIICVGVPIGLVLGGSPKIYSGLEFIIDFFRSLPITALFPVFMLFFGVGDYAKIMVTAFAGVLIVIFNTAQGIMNASKVRMLVARVMGASRGQLFRLVLFWESLPQIFIGSRIALNFVLVVAIVTEMFIGAQFGLGKRIIDFQITYDTDMMYAVIIVTGIFGYLLNVGFSLLQRRIVHWVG